MTEENQNSKIPELSEEDYYLDSLRRIVFTETYHLKRGFCCGSGCRHCPYQSAVPEPKDTTQKPPT